MRNFFTVPVIFTLVMLPLIGIMWYQIHNEYDQFGPLGIVFGAIITLVFLRLIKRTFLEG